MFEHHHTAHCETGVTSALLGNAGLKLSEPLAFGIGSGLFFLHAPLAKVTGFPLTSFRTYPGSIFRKTCRRLGVTWRRERFRSPARGMAALDGHLAAGRPVGLQTNIHWLPYFPPEFRSQFNAHNVIAIGIENGDYRISDPTLEAPVLCPADSLSRARFAKGSLAPRGLLYYPTGTPGAPEYYNAIRRGIRDTVFTMTRLPFPWTGVQGIRYLAAHVRKYPQKLKDDRKAKLHLAFIVRMQEEVGTGGAGFRFMYAAFLQEAAAILEREDLREVSRMMTAAGDLWREFAISAGRLLKGRDGGKVTFDTLAGQIEACAEQESKVFERLRGWA